MAAYSTDLWSAATDYISGLKAVLDGLSQDEVEGMISILQRVYEDDGQVFVIGNGGSAATASHMACDLSKTTQGNPPDSSIRGFRVQALTDNAALLTAWGNDVDYDAIFAEQIRTLARPGDLLLVITGSGDSANVVKAVQVAKSLGLSTLGLLGFAGGRVRELVDQAVIVNSDNYGYIEDAHLILTHLVTGLLKQRFARQTPIHEVVGAG